MQRTGSGEKYQYKPLREMKALPKLYKDVVTVFHHTWIQANMILSSL